MESKTVLVSVTDVINTCCVMEQGGMSYEQPSNIISACGLAFANSTEYKDVVIPICNRNDTLKRIAIEFGTGLVQASASAQVYSRGREFDEELSKSLDSAYNYMELIDNNGDMDWGTFISELDKGGESVSVLSSEAYKFKGSSVITVRKFLDMFVWYFKTKVNRLPDIRVPVSDILEVAKQGVSFKPVTYKDKLIYLYLFIWGICVLQSFYSLDKQSYFNLDESVSIIDKTMKSYTGEEKA